MEFRFSPLNYALAAILFVLIGALGGFVYWALQEVPETKTLESYKPIESTFVYSADGKVLAELFLERRSFVPHYQIPERLKQAFIAIEDQRFYSHSGVDLLGIMRAAFRNIMAGGVVQGGSTITQQLTKILFLRPEKSLSRKIKELVISLQIEKKYTKDEILGMYLNQSYFGTRAYGIEAAAQTYFGKSVYDLSVAESAMLAGLQKAPTMYSPFRNPNKAKARRQVVLGRMLVCGFISKEELEKANAEPMPVKPFHRKYAAPYFVEFLRQQIESRYGDKLYTSGMRIYSTIDSSLQESAEAAIAKGIETIHKRAKAPIQAALIAIDPKNGNIRAMVGGTDFWETQFNRATQAFRQPGSAFKPFVYAAALEDGASVDDELLDEPVSFPGSKPNTLWSPRNYDGEYRGYISMRTAIALSLNAATVRLADSVGIEKIIDLAKKSGIKSTLQPYLPIALGASDITPLELTAAYAVFSTGKKVDPVAYEKILTRNGITLEEVFPSPEEVLSTETVQNMRYLLKSVVDSGTATKAKELKRPVYGKTGTTNDFSDAWFIGFDEKLVVGVWVGRDDHTPIGRKEAGARAALPIWIDFMKNVH